MFNIKIECLYFINKELNLNLASATTEAKLSYEKSHSKNHNVKFLK